VGDGGGYSSDGCGMMNIMRRLLSHVGDGRVWASERKTLTRMMGCEAYKPKAPNPTTNDTPTRPNQKQMHCKRISSR